MASNIQGNINNILGQTAQAATLLSLTPLGQELIAKNNAKEEQATALKNIQLAEGEYELAKQKAEEVRNEELAKIPNPTNMDKIRAFIGTHPDFPDYPMAKNIENMKAEYNKQYNPAEYYKQLAAKNLMDYKKQLRANADKLTTDKNIIKDRSFHSMVGSIRHGMINDERLKDGKPNE